MHLTLPAAARILLWEETTLLSCGNALIRSQDLEGISMTGCYLCFSQTTLFFFFYDVFITLVSLGFEFIPIYMFLLIIKTEGTIKKHCKSLWCVNLKAVLNCLLCDFSSSDDSWCFWDRFRRWQSSFVLLFDCLVNSESFQYLKCCSLLKDTGKIYKWQYPCIGCRKIS